MTEPPINIYELQLARIGKEKSSALPARCYGDPAQYIQFESEIRQQQKSKQKKRTKGK